VATAVEGVGLVVPVLHDAQARDLFDTARALDELVRRARAGNLSPADVRGGTFTISNHGVSGACWRADHHPPAAGGDSGSRQTREAPGGAGGGRRAEDRGAAALFVTLTLDHRVMDGHQANHFLQVFVQTLTDWPA